MTTADAVLDEEEERRPRATMHTHPSGVELADPPEGMAAYLDESHQPLTGQKSSRLSLSFSRKSSKLLQRAR